MADRKALDLSGAAFDRQRAETPSRAPHTRSLSAAERCFVGLPVPESAKFRDEVVEQSWLSLEVKGGSTGDFAQCEIVPVRFSVNRNKYQPMARPVKVQAGMECSSGIFRSKRAQPHIMDAAVNFIFEAIKTCNELRNLFMTDV